MELFPNSAGLMAKKITNARRPSQILYSQLSSAVDRRQFNTLSVHLSV